METFTSHGRTLHATLCEVERGLFQISYRAEKGDRDVRYLPPYEVGACPADARHRIEQDASLYGYVAIIWDSAFPEPEPAPDPLKLPASNRPKIPN